jgi:hypothetical protein
VKKADLNVFGYRPPEIPGAGRHYAYLSSGKIAAYAERAKEVVLTYGVTGLNIRLLGQASSDADGVLALPTSSRHALISDVRNP